MCKTNSDGISIITIVLNGELLIESTILSVINQKDPKVEYIVIDGGSTDETLRIISKYKDKIDLVISEHDRGIYHAINKGIYKAKNNIVGLIHCGDFYEPNIFSIVYDEFLKTSADVLYGDINLIEESYSKKIIRTLNADHKSLVNRMSIYHPATFVKREVYINSGAYNLDYKIAADYDFFLNLYLNRMNFHYIPCVLANFRLGGISSTNKKLLFNENILIRKTRLGRMYAIKYMLIFIVVDFILTTRKSFGMFVFGEKNYFLIKAFLRREG